MAKLDEFGRPIYETAEEYNKAHKGGVCPRPYDSPDGSNYKHPTMNGKNNYQSVAQKHATQTASQNAKKIILAIAVFIIALNVGIIVTMITMTAGTFGEIHQEFEEGVVGTEEVLVDYNETIPLPEGFNEFYYNGEYYSLPTNYEQITKMGLVLEEYSENDMIPDEYEEILGLYDEYVYARALIRISNYTGAEIPVEKSTVDYFYIINQAVYDSSEDKPDFVFGDGLSFDSSYEEVEEYLGVPDCYYEDRTEDDDYYQYYQWIYYKDADIDSSELDEAHFIEVSFYNGDMQSVSIEKKEIQPK